jgi:predicted nuclease of predicted toxin-antitoxin system
MLRLLTDENFNHRILRALRLRVQSLDYVTVQSEGLTSSTDEQLLEWAANNNRVIVTHDVRTMPDHAATRLAKQLGMPGLIIVPNKLELGQATDELQIIIECAGAADLKDGIYFLPL